MDFSCKPLQITHLDPTFASVKSLLTLSFDDWAVSQILLKTESIGNVGLMNIYEKVKINH